MKIVSLFENTACDARLHKAHGLSIYLETPKHRILFDMGPDPTALENAGPLGIDLAAVDVAILSHGHSDHGGGLPAFLAQNARARVYVRRDAFLPHFARRSDGLQDIGVDPSLAALGDRLVQTDGDLAIDEELFLFSEIEGQRLLPTLQGHLMEKGLDGEILPDRFLHEQSLLVTAQGKSLVIGGCAHRGIVNILEAAERRLGHSPDLVVSGFHLCNPATGEPDDPALIAAIGEALQKRPTRYATGHCTGPITFQRLEKMLGDRIFYFSGGQSVVL